MSGWWICALVGLRLGMNLRIANLGGIRPTPATIFVDDAAISTARVGP
jgi:hypothetical protein